MTNRMVVICTKSDAGTTSTDSAIWQIRNKLQMYTQHIIVVKTIAPYKKRM